MLGAVVIGSIAIALGLSLFAEPVAARSTGITNYSGNPDPDNVVGGETVTVTVNVSGGPGIAAGFNASVSDFAGSLIATGNDTRIEAGQITHTSPKQMVDGEASFDFDWTPPAEADVVSIFAAALSTDGGGGTTGDGVGTASIAVQIQAPGGLGDVDCSGDLNILDALIVAQYEAGVRTDAGACPLSDSTTQLILANADINGDEAVDILDALILAQCDADNNQTGFCPDPIDEPA